MKGKYMTIQVRMACLSKPSAKPDIYQQLEETLTERKRILQQLAAFTRTARIVEMIVHDTIAA
jgi:hypothetical protein